MRNSDRSEAEVVIAQFLSRPRGFENLVVCRIGH